MGLQFIHALLSLAYFCVI